MHAGDGPRCVKPADLKPEKPIYCPRESGGRAFARPSLTTTTHCNNNKYDPGSQDGGADQAGSVRVMPVR